VAKVLTRPTGPTPPATTTPPLAARPGGPGQDLGHGQERHPPPGPRAQVTARLNALGFRAANGGNAPPSEATSLTHAKGSVAAVTTVARVVKAGGKRVAQVGQPGLGANSVILVLGSDFKGVARGVAVPKAGSPTPAQADRGHPRPSDLGSPPLLTAARQVGGALAAVAVAPRR
jgi:hypothetical protein